MEAMGGDLGEGTRFYAGLALERIHRSNCLRAIQALVSGPTEEVGDELLGVGVHGSCCIFPLRPQLYSNLSYAPCSILCI